LILRIAGLADPSGRAVAAALQSALESSGAGSVQLELRPVESSGRGAAVAGLVEEMARGSLDLIALEAGLLPNRLPVPLVGRVLLPRKDSRTACLTPTAPGTMLRELPDGVRVGALHAEQLALLRALHPGLLAVDLRGRGPDELIGGLEGGDLGALLVPAWWVGELVSSEMGIELLNRITWVPAPGEGAIGAIFDRTSEFSGLVEGLIDASTAAEVRAELAFLESVEAAPDTVVCASCLSFGPGLRLKGLLMSEDGTRAAHADRTGSVDAPEPLGWAVAADVVRQSAEILA
jgi:hydroxymethylbilane synthase